MKNEDNINNYCQKVVQLDTKLPLAIHLFNNKWAVASRKDLKFSTVCHNESENMNTLVVKPVVDIIQLKQTCFAFNDYFTFALIYIEGLSHYDLKSDVDCLLAFKNTTRMGIWKVFHDKFPNFTKIKLPAQLKSIPKIPMDQLISKFDELQQGDLTEGYPSWAYGLIGISWGIVIAIGIVLYCKFRNKCKSNLTAKVDNEKKQSIVPPGYRYYRVMTVPGNPDRTIDSGLARVASAPPPDGTDHCPEVDNVIHKIYPTLNMSTTG